MEFVEALKMYWLCGIAGGLAHDICSFGGLGIGSYDRKARVLRLGFVGSAFIGVIVAALVDGSQLMAFAFAMAGPQGLEGLAKQVAQRVRKEKPEVPE